MAHLAPPRQRPANRRRILAASGIAVLAITTVVLCAFALTQFQGEPSSTPTGTSATAPSPPSSTSPEASGTASPSTSPPTALLPPTRLLSAFDGARIYRATTGKCPDPAARFELSIDGGLTWQESDIAGRTGSTAALNVTAGTAVDFVQLVTLRSGDCAPQYIRSFVGGIDWQVFDSELPATWFFNPSSPTVANSPEGSRALPCTAVSLIAAGQRAAVMCEDSTLHTTTDSGASWSDAIVALDVAAIGLSPDGYRIAFLNAAGCQGIQVGELTGAEIGALGACLELDASQTDVAVTTAGDGTTFVWAADVFAASSDGGATW